MINNFQPTIAAITTPIGTGAIGMIRISGEESISIFSQIFSNPKKILDSEPYKIHFGRIIDEYNITLDEVLISIFKAPHSFTGENTVEITTHGSSNILKRVMELLIRKGVSLAMPGEFTQRAFLNGKMDLAQAEAVADLIASSSDAERKAALAQMKGGYSQKLEILRTSLIDFTALLELELDFGEEDVEFADRTQFFSLIKDIKQEIKSLMDSYSTGNGIKEGIKTVIAGKPNAGKSTLLNQLLQEEKAIVSDIPGTTRDVIEDIIIIEGIKFRLMDTAGIRKSEDTIEKLGVEKTYQKMEEADVIIYLYDKSLFSESELSKELSELPRDKKIILVGNKNDLAV